MLTINLEVGMVNCWVISGWNTSKYPEANKCHFEGDNCCFGAKMQNKLA